MYIDVAEDLEKLLQSGSNDHQITEKLVHNIASKHHAEQQS